MQTSQKPENTILTTQDGLEVELLNYGATLKSISVPVGDEIVNVLLNYPADEDSVCYEYVSALNYADYYYREALIRCKNLDN